MTIIAPPPPGSGADFTPIMAYKANQGRLYLRDRTQDAAGNWQAHETEVTQQKPTFAVDFGRIEIGWCHFVAGGAPLWVMVPYGNEIPPMPPSPGNDDKGKALQYRQGFRVPVAGTAIGGIRELAGNSAAMINGINELHNTFESAAEAGAGKVPLVQMVDTLPVKTGQTTNFQPVFSIVGWVDRPDTLGPRTVAPPRGAVAPAAVPQAPAMAAAQTVAPAMAAPMAAPVAAPMAAPVATAMGKPAVPAGMPF